MRSRASWTPLGKTRTPVLELEDLTENMEGGRPTDILIVDFAKAFDKENYSTQTPLLWNQRRGQQVHWRFPDQQTTSGCGGYPLRLRQR